MKCHPSLSLLVCLTVHYHCNFLGRDPVTRAAFTGKLLQQLQREFGTQMLERAQGNLQLQHLSLKPCSHPGARTGSALLAVLTPSFPTRKTAEQWIPRVSSFPFLGFSTCRVRACQGRPPHLPCACQLRQGCHSPPPCGMSHSLSHPQSCAAAPAVKSLQPRASHVSICQCCCCSQAVV